MTAISQISSKPVSSASAAFFRILFGLLMSVAVIRFIFKGWVYDFYVKPIFYFTFYGFSWVKPLPEWAIYSLFWLMALLGIFISFGFLYRLSIVLFFLIFTYIELIDVTNYLNHYYLVSLLSLLMIFLPLNSNYALDATLGISKKKLSIPQWVIAALRIQIGIVYFFGGISKIKYDWLIEAQPLKIWLSANSHWPVIGPLFDQEWVAYLFSWGGMLFDLFIPFLLLWKRTRLTAFILVIVFHILTALLFPIGMFPWIMTISVLIFFPTQWHQKVLSYFFKEQYLPVSSPVAPTNNNFIVIPVALFFLVQCAMPFRYLLYPGNLLWTEQGYRFSWNIMLIEKRAHIEFYTTETNTSKTHIIILRHYLTKQQQLMMSTQPDMILQFAHFIKEQFQKQGITNIAVTAECYATLNGNKGRLLIDPKANLAEIQDGWGNKNWITEYHY